MINDKGIMINVYTSNAFDNVYLLPAAGPNVCSLQVYSLLYTLIQFTYQRSLLCIIKQCNIAHDFTFLINVLPFWSKCPPLQHWPTFYGIFLEEMFIHKYTLKIQAVEGVTTQELPPLAGTIMHY